MLTDVRHPEPTGAQSNWKLVLGLFLLAYLLRVLVCIQFAQGHPFADRPAGSEAAREAHALELVEGTWVGDRTFFHAPLPDYFLGAIFAVRGVEDELSLRGARATARHTQALLGALACLGVYFLTRRLFGARAALVALVGAATYRPLLWLPALFVGPNLFVPLFLAALLCLPRAHERELHAQRWLWSGLFLAACGLVQGSFLFFLPLFIALPFWRRARFRGTRGRRAQAFLLAWGMGSLLVPLALRNQRVDGELSLANVSVGTSAYLASSSAEGGPPDFLRGIPAYELEDWTREAQRRSGVEALTPRGVGRFWLAEASGSLLHEPGASLSGLWNRLRRVLGARELAGEHDPSWDARYVSLLRLPFGGFGLWGWLGGAGLLLVFARRRAGPAVADERAARELALWVVLWLVTMLLVVPDETGRAIGGVLLLPFAGFLVMDLAGALVARRLPSMATGVALFVAALPVFVPELGGAPEDMDLDARDLELAAHLLEQGELAQAHDLMQREDAAHGPRSELLRAELAYHAGRRRIHAPEATRWTAGEVAPELELALERVRALDGADTSLQFLVRVRALAGLIQLELERLEAAERDLRLAAQLDPTDRRIRRGLADVLFLRAIDTAPNAQTEAWLLESHGLLEGLFTEGRTRELEDRLAQVTAELVRN